MHGHQRREPTLLGGLLMGGFVAGALFVGIPIVLAAAAAGELAVQARRRAKALLEGRP